MPVLRIGGVFFRAADPLALSAWYREHLGVGAGCVSSDAGAPVESAWQVESGQVESGPVVFAPLKADSDYFAADRAFMLNLRVRDLDSLLEQLNAAGVDILTKPEWNDPATGQFARIHDPEGNAIKLWEQPVA